MDGDLSWPLARAARLHGSAEAVVYGGRRVSYAQLAQRVAALGGLLDDLALAGGARVGVLASNSLAHLECWLGIPAHGRVIVDLNLRLTAAELAELVDDAEAEALIVDAARLETGLELLSRCSGLRALIVDGADEAVRAAGAANAEGAAGAVGVAGDWRDYEAALAAAAPATAPGVDGDALAAISYTGGTTGRAKGVMLSHGNLLANAKHNIVITGHRPQDTFLHVCPMFHAAGIANVFASTWVGARQVVLPRFDPAAVAEAIARERVTLTTLVPTMLAMLLERLEQVPADLSSLRNLHYAASPISPALQRRVVQVLGCEIAQMYGMTEAAPTVTHLSPEVHARGVAGEEPHARRLASVGIPVVGVEAEVRDLDGVPLGPGEVGELWVRGPNVMLGYWRRPEATAAALTAAGWYRTGDLGHADADGYLYLVDRLKDMIITGGENVYSIEVEAVLADHPAVREAAVFGVPDPRWGEAVHAVVCADPDAAVDGPELIAHCRARLAAFKAPRVVEVRREPLPKSGAGKLLKNLLREPFWAEQPRRVS